MRVANDKHLIKSHFTQRIASLPDYIKAYLPKLLYET